MNSPLSYLGGKSRLSSHIVAQIPVNHVCYCEPFCGAAWVFFRKPESRVEVLNDRDRDLVTFWRVVQNHIEEFLRYMKYAVTSRVIFDLEQKKDPDTLTDIQRAVRYYYLQRLAFGGKTHKRHFGTSAQQPSALNIMTIQETLLDVHWRLSRVTFECLPAVDCIARYDRPTTFFHVDPPHHGTVGYSTPFAPADYLALRDCLGKIKGRFLLSLNDCPAVRLIFKDFRCRKVSTSYSVSNGRASCHNRAARRGELLIRNF